MEKVGKQIKLPLRRAFQIAVQGIRVRLSRSLVTVSGVVLGIAFLMSNITAQLVKNSIGQEREMRQTIKLMETLIRVEIGEIEGENLAVAGFGALLPIEQALLDRLVAARPAGLTGWGISTAGVTPVALPELGADAEILLVLGNSRQASVSLAELAGRLNQKIVLDSVADRVYPGNTDPAVRREAFFGKATKEQLEKIHQQARQSRARTLWIVIISVLVTVIGITNALLMSVTERFREIGTMKCLGALSSFIRRLFLIESALIGFCGSLVGMAVGGLLPIVVYGFSFGFQLVLGQMNYGLLSAAAVGAVAVGALLAMLAAIYPANFAARMVPATALRTNI